MKIWRNGDIVNAAGAIDADDRGVTLGDGIFETIAIIDGEPLRLEKHLSRLEYSASVLSIPFKADTKIWRSAINDILSAEHVTEGSARITLLRGSGLRGVLPPAEPKLTYIIFTNASEVGANLPIRAIITESTRRNELSPLASIKSTNYLDAIVARLEADKADVEEAIMLNTRGHIAEATSSNIFCVKDDQIMTPPVSDGALPGIMRGCVIGAFDIEQVSITPEMLIEADEVFLTSSLNIRPVVQLNGATIGSGKPGPVAASLNDLPRTAT